MRSAIEKGQSLTPEFLAGLTERPPPRNSNRDLRFGVIAVAFGVGIASFGWIGGGDEAKRILMAVGNVPKSRVRSWLRQLMRDAAYADDLAQDVFIVVWERAYSFAGRGSFAAWLR